MPKDFNANVLRIARQARGFSQAELSRNSGVSQGNISKLENALIEPTEDVLDKLADTLHFPASIFFEQDKSYGLPLSVHPNPMYRKKASVGQRSLERLEAELNIRLMHVRRLLKSAEYEGELPLPELDLDEYGEDPEGVAALVRRTWLVPSGPLIGLMDYIERAGCLVIHCDFPGMTVDGVTLNVPGTPRCIFLNKSQPADRQRFTLAHELGHIVMHRLPSPTMEDEANAFASALLMPANDIRPYFRGRLTIQKLAQLKPMWRVSMAALLFRSRTVGALSDNQSQYLWRQMSSMGYRRQEPAELDLKPETPSVMPEIVRMHLEDLGYGVGELAKALHVYEDDFRKIHELGDKRGGPYLQIIK